jgi:hypothetical protein
MHASMNGRGNPQTLMHDLAHQLGQEAFEKAKDQASEVVSWEKVRREKANLSEIAALKARYDCLFRSREEFLEILRLAPSGDPKSLLHRRLCYQVFALTLVITGVFFAHLALAPFGLGPEAWVLCLGIGCVAAFWTERTLDHITTEAFLKCVCVLALLASIGGLLIMALLRGDILALYLKNSIEATGDPNAAGTSFYTDAIWKLQLLMALLAVAMELGSGMAMFEAGKLNLDAYARAKEAKKELVKFEAEMGAIIGRVTHLTNDPAVNEAEFWRNFYLGLFDRAKKNGLTHFFTFLLFIASGAAHPAAAQVPTNINAGITAGVEVVIALDLTQSVAGRGYDGKTDYEKNVDAACRLITQLPPGSQLTVFAITDKSFSQPYMLLRRELPTDKGPLQFQDRIAIAKAQGAAELRKLALSSPRSFTHTDIFGALILAADILGQSNRRKALVLFSDMRESTSDIDFERLKTISQRETLATAERHGLIARLQHVDLYVLGVDGTGKPLNYWNSLRDFWEAYFRRAGADLKEYSALRDFSFANQY